MKTCITVCEMNGSVEAFAVSVGDAYDIKSDDGLSLKNCVISSYATEVTTDQINVLTTVSSEVPNKSLCARLNHHAVRVIRQLSRKKCPHAILYVTCICENADNLPEVIGIVSRNVNPDLRDQIESDVAYGFVQAYAEYGEDIYTSVPAFDGVTIYCKNDFEQAWLRDEGFYVLDGKFYASEHYSKSDDCSMYKLVGRSECEESCDICNKYICITDAAKLLDKYTAYKNTDACMINKVNAILSKLDTHCEVDQIIKYLPKGKLSDEALSSAIREAVYLQEIDEWHKHAIDVLGSNPSMINSLGGSNNELYVVRYYSDLIFRGSDSGDIVFSLRDDLIMELLENIVADVKSERYGIIRFVGNYAVKVIKTAPGYLQIGYSGFKHSDCICTWGRGPYGNTAIDELLTFYKNLAESH